jgi:hypothetical protein
MFIVTTAVEMFASVIAELKTQIANLTASANETGTRIANAGNEAVLVQEVRENSDDPKLVELRAWRDAALAEIAKKEEQADRYIRKAGMVNLEPVDVDAETLKYKELATAVKDLRKAVVSLPGVTDEVLADSPALVPLPGQRGPRQGSGTGTSRPRIAQVFVNGEEIYQTKKVKQQQADGSVIEVDEKVANFTVLAAQISKLADVKVDVKDLHEAAFSAAKTRDLSSLNGTPVEFSFNAGKDGAQKEYFVKLIPSVKGAAE